MKRLMVPLAVAAVFALVFSAGAPRAYACSCAVLSPQEYVDNADVIVVGIVTRAIDGSEQFPAAPENSGGNGTFSIPDVDAVITVERYLKGTGPAEIVADDPPSGGTCGFFEESSIGSRYLLVLTGEESPFRTDLCSGSTALDGGAQQLGQDRLQEILAITGPGAPPQGGAAPTVEQPDDGIPWLPITIASSLSGIALLAASAFLLRRRIIRGG